MRRDKLCHRGIFEQKALACCVLGAPRARHSAATARWAVLDRQAASCHPPEPTFPPVTVMSCRQPRLPIRLVGLATSPIQMVGLATLPS